MEVGYVYRANSAESAWDAVQELDKESKDLLVGLALILLVRDNGDADWYVFGNLEDPKSADRVRISQILSAHGIPTDLSFKGLAENPHLGGVFSGTLEQIKTGFTVAMAKYRPDLFSK